MSDTTSPITHLNEIRAQYDFIFHSYINSINLVKMTMQRIIRPVIATNSSVHEAISTP